MISHALTFARRKMLKIEAVGRLGRGTIEGPSNKVMHWKIMFDRYYCIYSTRYLLKFGKKYGSIFCHRLAFNE